MSNKPIFNKDLWHRIECRQTPIYVQPDKPDWFVPNATGDKILQSLKQNPTGSCGPEVIKFLKRVPDSHLHHYAGRSACSNLEQLREVWFHMTNQCNLACSHCLFGSSAQSQGELSVAQILSIAKDAYNLGCRVFALTGGEPFVHPDIHAVIIGLLKFADTHVAVLTNGMNLPGKLEGRQFDYNRLHFQISIDGIGQSHDSIRGQGAFNKLDHNLEWLQKRKIPYTISMCVTRQNVQDMSALVEFAARKGAGNVHFLWYFIRGRGKRDGFVPVDNIFRNLVAAAECAEALNMPIDNIESLKTQIFVPAGTAHDGSTAGWQSAAVGPDGRLYPSAALVGVPELATDMPNGIEAAWHESPVLKNIRGVSAITMSSPLRFFTGGGDIDHSYIHNKTFIGDDPYQLLYEKIILWLLSREAQKQPDHGAPQIRLRMGEILESCGAHGKVSLVHSNCLLAMVHKDSLSVVKSFYAEAVGDQKDHLLNPVCYEKALIDHIPKAYRFRGYGCGSPVLDADIRPGEFVVDLGCGSGVECFVAARLTGKRGQVTGIDMLEPMLELAHKGAQGVAANLGFGNIEFQKGYLEALPLKDASADVVLSNCVMNLSVHKRKAYAEILRILKPGGRMVIADVVCDTEPDTAIRNDETLKGECIAGAMVQHHLMGLLEEIGFQGIRLIKRFAYRTVQGHPFFSLTYCAEKPKASKAVRVIYRGPLPHLATHDGTLLIPGEAMSISQDEALRLGDQVFRLDESGNVLNIKSENRCSCATAPEAPGKTMLSGNRSAITLFPRRASGCMVCGAPITYLAEDRDCRCAYCRKTLSTHTRCEKGHFVCDACHVEDGLKVIKHICTSTDETDMVRLFELIRRHPALPVHGPEHHALVPGVILATYHNLGGDLPASVIEVGIKRGATVAGGSCAFMGVCGAAEGVGIAFSLILAANPLSPAKRSIVQRVTQSALAEIAKLKAARCCQRDAWLALKKAAVLSQKYLPVPLKADALIYCGQQHQNKECIRRGCPMFCVNPKKSHVHVRSEITAPNRSEYPNKVMKGA